MAEQHRLTGNTAFKSNNYQQAIDSYTKSITLDNSNPVVYMNRAIARKLSQYILH
jgi:Flp pilus assembly protein TadD